MDGSGHAYITGSTSSNNFPTTPGAFDTTYDAVEAFVTKFNLDGSALSYSTFLGGADQGSGIAIDSEGNAYVVGQTHADNLPATAGAFDTTYNGGSDAFVVKLNSTGSGLHYATYLGGTGGDFASGIALDAFNVPYVAGYTRSNDFPTTPFAFDGIANGGEDVFITKLTPNGTGLVYSTYLGGSSSFPIGGDYGSAIAVDTSNNVYVAGQTYGSDFPTTPGRLSGETVMAKPTRS